MEMQGTLWHLSADRWEELFVECGKGVMRCFECVDGEPSIPMEVLKGFGNEVPLSRKGEPVGFEQRPNSPTNFGFMVLVEGNKVMSFCAKSKKDLILWKKWLKQAQQDAEVVVSPPSSPTMILPAPPSQGEVDREDDSASSYSGERSEETPLPEPTLNINEGAPVVQNLAENSAPGSPVIDDDDYASVSNQQNPPPPQQNNSRDSVDERLNDEVDTEKDDSMMMDEFKDIDNDGSMMLSLDNDDTMSASTKGESLLMRRDVRIESVSSNRGDDFRDEEGFTVTVFFEDYELDFTFASQKELDQVSLVELKEALCMKLASDEDRVIAPQEIELRLGDAVLRDYWRGEDFCLMPSCRLSAHLRERVQGLSHAAAKKAREKKVLLTVSINIGSSENLLALHEGEDPDIVAAELIRQLGLNPAQSLPVACELHKRLAEKYADENYSLRNQVLELKRRLHLQEAPQGASAKTREMYETLLEKTNLRMEALQAEKDKMADQLFELRLVNAMRLSTEP